VGSGSGEISTDEVTTVRPESLSESEFETTS
jgi:hypothetical protein